MTLHDGGQRKVYPSGAEKYPPGRTWEADVMFDDYVPPTSLRVHRQYLAAV